jgi:membrane associated rhomboid family serine protease
LVNIAVYLVVNIVYILVVGPTGNPALFQKFVHFFSASHDLGHLLWHPWTPITSMFLHVDFGHVLWNMITFWWFGRVVGDLVGNHRVLPLYLLGGLAGSLFYFIAAKLHFMGLGQPDEYALGASAAVMGMVACAASIAPDFIFNVLLIGPIKLKYIAFFLMFLDLVAIAGRANTGGHLAHVGGAALGFFYVAQLHKGIDIAKPITRLLSFLSQLFSGRTKTKAQKKFSYQRGGNDKAYAESRRAKQEATTTKAHRASDTEGVAKTPESRLDAILDKIKLQGYNSLSQEEKDFLDKASQK